MLTDEEKKERMGYIGASEAAGVLGLSRWQTPLQIWALKTGQIQYGPETLPQWVGTEMETVVAKRFMQETGLDVYPSLELFKHPDHDFIACHIDTY